MSCTHKMAASNLAASELHSDTLPAKPIETGQPAPQSHLPESQARPKLQQSHSQQSQPSQAPIQTLPPTSTTSATNKLPLTSSVSQKEAARQPNPPLKSYTSAQQSPTSNKSDSAFSTSSSSTCSPTNESCNLSELTSSSSSQSSTLSSSSSLDEGNISTDSSSAVQSLVVSISSSDSRGEKKNESSSECDNNHEEPAVETTGSDLPATTAGFSRPKQDGLSTSEDEGSSVCSSFTRPASQASNHLQGTKHQGLATSTSSPTPETATTGAADSNSSSSSSNSSTCDAYATKFAYDGHQLNPYLNQAPAPYLMSHQHVPLMVQLPPAHLYGAQYGSRSGAEHLMANYCTLLPTAYTPQPAIYTAVPHTYPYHQYQQLFLLPAPIPPQQSHPLPPHQPHHSHHHHQQQQQQHHLHHNYNNHQHNFQPTTVTGQGSGIEEHDYHGHYATADSASLYSHPTNHQQLALVPGQLLQPRVGLPPFVPAYYAPMRSQTLPTTTLNAMSLQASQQPPFPTMMYAESLLNVPIDQSTMGFFEDPSVTTSASHTDGSPLMAFSQLKLGYNLIPMLPIDAPPTQTRQAYGMDKVWHEEFEHLFSQFVSSIVWTLLEVEFNPSLIDCDSIVGYRGRYLIRAGNVNSSHSLASGSVNEDENEVDDTCTSTSPQHTTDRCSEGSQSIHCEDHDNDHHVSNDDESDSISVSSNECHSESTGGSSSTRTDDVQVTSTSDSIKVNETESDCDSGAVVNSTSGCSEPSTKSSSVEEEETSRSVTAEDKINESAGNDGKPVRRFPTRFRMFIDSAKVRFCCDHCGHGWTSMKGRVVFWYELFELVDLPEHMSIGGHNLIGYCAYKLFGQQCDVCKIENRFERPMWYPEEVTKVLNNLYNKIGQVYFGFKMPAIDKQRRAGKPRTSHNSSLCQACHDGVCTDRK